MKRSNGERERETNRQTERQRERWLTEIKKSTEENLKRNWEKDRVLRRVWREAMERYEKENKGEFIEKVREIEKTEHKAECEKKLCRESERDD